MTDEQTDQPHPDLPPTLPLPTEPLAAFGARARAEMPDQAAMPVAPPVPPRAAPPVSASAPTAAVVYLAGPPPSSAPPAPAPPTSAPPAPAPPTSTPPAASASPPPAYSPPAGSASAPSGYPPPASAAAPATVPMPPAGRPSAAPPTYAPPVAPAPPASVPPVAAAPPVASVPPVAVPPVAVPRVPPPAPVAQPAPPRLGLPQTPAPAARPAPVPPAHPGSGPGPVLVQLGEVSVTATTVHTPAGDIPLRGSQWTVSDQWHSEQRIPTWAVVCAVVGFLFLCFLSLLFLLAKETRYSGTVQVTISNAGRQYVVRIPVTDQRVVAHIHAQVNYVRSLAAL